MLNASANCNSEVGKSQASVGRKRGKHRFLAKAMRVRKRRQKNSRWLIAFRK